MRGSPDETSSAYRMPAEWEPHEAVWLSWPHQPESWPGMEENIEREFARFAAHISRHEILRLNVRPEKQAFAERTIREAGAMMDRVEIYVHPNNDAWCRDHGPIFVKHRKTGDLAVTDWTFNGWGEKFGPWDDDDRIPRLIAESLQLPVIEGNMVLEGGAIEVNERGQLLTTEAVLLNPNRNPTLTKTEIEGNLRRALGVQEIFWLGEGLEGDDTDGHIDDIARFVDNERVVLAWEPDEEGWNQRVLHENRERLQDFRTPEGGKLEIIELDLPRLLENPEWRLPVTPANYVNFLILNGAVIVPVFGDESRDKNACGLLGELFPGREVITVPSVDFVKEGGAVHCLSQQQPAAG